MRFITNTVLIVVALFVMEISGNCYLTGEEYWNTLYNMGYGGRFYGFWSHGCGYSRSATEYSYFHRICSGCSCDYRNRITDCSTNRGNVQVRSTGLFNATINKGYFHRSVAQIALINLPLQKVEFDTFGEADNLTHLTIHRTQIQQFPDLSNNSKLQWIDLSENRISFFPNHHKFPSIPPSATHVNLVSNQISWIPRGLFSGTNIRFLALSRNKIGPVLPSGRFINMSALQYISFDGNQISEISKSGLNFGDSPNLQHLNLSNNMISVAQANAFSNTKSLKILEMHNNMLKDFESCVFFGMPGLRHIDLHYNLMEVVQEKAFNNMPKLERLRLHNQNIRYMHRDSLYIFSNLKEVFVSGNSFTTFPHNIFEWKDWDNLITIHADNCALKGIHQYPEPSHHTREWQHWVKLSQKFEPFRNLTNVQTMFLHNNAIERLEENTFCHMPNLRNLQLHGNLLTSSSINSRVFICIPNLNVLDLARNRLQFVPKAISSNESLQNLQQLTLTSNQIICIPSDEFTHLMRLTSLQLDHNNIKFKLNTTFNNMTTLTALYLSNNQIDYIPGTAFRGLSNLQTLGLTNNQIDYIPRTVFRGLSNLQTLGLANNKIPFIPVEMLEDSSSIVNLYLSNNEITYIEEGAFAHHLWNGLWLNLASNWIAHLPSPAFGDFANRTTSYVWLTSNYIERVHSYQFSNFRFTNRFDLTNNHITVIEPFGFTSVFSSGDLILGGNPLKDLRPFSFHDVSVDELFMQSAQTETLVPCTFRALTAWRVEMYGSRIRTLQGPVFCGVSISYQLSLDRNQITEINSSLFANNSYVNRLRLNNNNIALISDEAFDDTAINYLYLDHNQLVDLPGRFGAINLGTLSLQWNQIERLRPGVFDGLTSLRYLYLNHNQVKILRSNVLDGLHSLQMLTLNDNQIATLESGVFSSIPSSLYQIDLRRNQIKHMMGVGDLGNLRYLYLDNNNDIKTFDIGAFDDVRDTIQSCEMVRTLLPVESSISGGQCEDQGTSLSNLLQAVNETASLFYCTGKMFTGYVSNYKELVLEWERPTFLYYELSNISVEIRGVSLDLGVDCLCRNESVQNEIISNNTAHTNETLNANETLLPNNMTTPNQTQTLCGEMWNTTEQCIVNNVAYRVSCQSGSSTLSLTTSNTSAVFGNPEAGSTYQCTVRLLFNHSESSLSHIVWLTVPASEQDEICNNSRKWTLPIFYYDFSVSHPDFDQPLGDIPSNPHYIASPTTSWLADLRNPNSTNLQDWYRDLTGTNILVNSYIDLKACFNENETFRFYNATYYPLDGNGFGSELQRNCSDDLHNAGYTSAIRSAIVYQGDMGITIGGGEDMWFFLNTILVANYHNYETIACVTTKILQRNDAEKKIRSCTTSYFSPVTFSGGKGLFDVHRMTGLVVDGNCSVSYSNVEVLDLDLQMGDTYHFDLFHAERNPCSSEFLFEVTNVTFTEMLGTTPDASTVAENTNTTSSTTATPTSTAFASTQTATVVEPTSTTATLNNETTNLNQNLTIYQPAVDLLVVVPENLEIGSYIVTFGLGLQNGSWKIEITNETDIDDYDAFVLSAKNGQNITSSSTIFVNGSQRIVDGRNFTDCSTLTGTHSSNPTQWRRLDYEAKKFHLLNISIENVLTNETWNLQIKVKVSDVNDNCPVVNPGNVNVSLLHPSLSTSVPIVTLNATDADSGINSQINYVISSTTQRDFSNYSKIIDFVVVAYDGSEISLGTIVMVQVEVSNTCMLSSNGKLLSFFVELQSDLNSGVAQLYLRVPRYYATGYDCNLPLGIEDFSVPVTAISASSENSTGNCGTTDFAYYARLNRETTYDKHGSRLAGAWVPAFNDTRPWIQIDFQDIMRLRSVLIQGSPEYTYWVTSYVISYSNDGVLWTLYKPREFFGVNETNCAQLSPNASTDNNATNTTTTGCYILNDEIQTEINESFVIQGNNDPNTSSRFHLEPNVYARFVRLHPVSWRNGIALRLEIYGCVAANEIRVESKCHPCPPSYYCPGDGRKLPCGRCDDHRTIGTDDSEASDLGLYPLTCGRIPTEYSFGVVDVCQACPTGHICNAGVATPCPPYTYNTGCNATTCSQCMKCPPGHACHSGTLYPCEAGRFSSDGRTDTCLSCPSGTFNTEVRSTSCQPCPSGYFSSTGSKSCSPCIKQEWSSQGDSHCRPCYGECPCLFDTFPCFPGVQCINKLESNSSFVFECKVCPTGYEGDGITCTDIDECIADPKPCWNEVSCFNTDGGFFCGPCPSGYHGEPYFGYGLKDVLPGQECHDLDECELGMCDALTSCSNTAGSFACGRCPEGYTGTGETGCSLLTPCRLTSRRCGSNASCLAVNFNNALCECPFGLTGPGQSCGPDDDADGQPDNFISCGDVKACAADNCVGIPNSGQEDADGDRMGDACDEDDDNDFIPDNQDNCPVVPNYNTSGVQLDSDGDGYGDACDTCPFLAGQFPDTDNDGLGDACDDDDDNDGFNDTDDFCPLDPIITNGSDVDGDRVGDACDNCFNVSNTDQSDIDQNGFGDACDNGIDTDGDGVIDDFDNCVSFPNPSQSDYDGDGLGDSCDNDIDDDGIENQLDYCNFVSDALATNDSACRKDLDQDGVDDIFDHCPNDPTISETSFASNFIVNLNTGSPDPVWDIQYEGKSVTQSTVSIPSLLIGYQRYASMNFTGGIFVNEQITLGNYIGLVFGYQSNRKFYAVLWSGASQSDVCLTGLHIKVVNSNTGPSSTLAQALWNTGDTANQAKIIYHDSNITTWQPKTPYLFHIIHRPSTGLIRVIVLQQGRTLIDSGNVYDTTYTGGRTGVLAFEQANVIWSNLQIKCVERENMALQILNDGGYVLLPNTSQILEDSFTIEMFINPDIATSDKPLPVFCTTNGNNLCIFVENSDLTLTMASNFTITNLINPKSWNHVTVRYDLSSCELSLIVNGTIRVTLSDVPNVDWSASALAIGWDGTNRYNGLIDEIRIYDRALTDAQMNDFRAKTGLNRETLQKILTGHYDMNYDDFSSGVLKDRSLYNNVGTLVGKVSFTKSSADVARYLITN